jgi:hypothetical protein
MIDAGGTSAHHRLRTRSRRPRGEPRHRDDRGLHQGQEDDRDGKGRHGVSTL